MSAPKLRFGEFDGDWELTKLENKIDFLAGYAFDSKLMSNDVQSYQLIKMSNVYQNKLDITRNPSYWKILDKKIEKFLLSKGDIVLTLTGTVGKTDYGYNVEITEENKFILNQRLVRLRGKLDKSNSKFIQHRISTDRFFYHFFNSSKGGTGNQSNVSIEDLKLLELPFPSLQEQTKIASFLSAVDEKINQLTQKHALLSQYKQGMMQKLFSQQLRFKADDGGEFGDWEEKNLNEMGENIIGLTYSPNDVTTDGSGILVLRSSNIKKGRLDKNDQVRVSKSIKERIIIKPNDILICARNGSQRLIGKSVLINDSEEMTFGAFMSVYRSKYNHFISYLMQSPWFFEQVQMNLGARINQITTGTLNEFTFDFPELEEQTKIANFLSAIDQKIEVVAQQIEQAKQWKKGLLQQMFV